MTDLDAAYPYPDMTFVFQMTRTIYKDPVTYTDATDEEFQDDLRGAIEAGLIEARE
jgi:hypothetical protein